MKRLSVLFALMAIFALPLVACSDDDGGNAEICGNGLDDDGNGQTDCQDSACVNSAYCQQACNNDGICGTGENATNCMNDCHCGNGICDSAAPYSETATSCPADCSSTGCDNDGTCEPAQGETATNCPADCATNPCDNDGTCEPAQGETATNCAADCATNPCDNDGTCDAGETATNCPADCGTVTCPDVYGVFDSIDYTSTFILDYAQIQDQAYQQAHQDAIQTTPAFEGTWQTSDVAIPPTGAAGTMAYALHIAADGTNPAAVVVVQLSMDGQQNTLEPTVQLMFSSDSLAAGSVAVGLGQNDTAQMFLFGADDCFAAIVVGTLNIDAASNTTATDGGTLELSGADVEFYHPSVTPYGDISADVEGAGYTVCDCL